MFFNTTMKSMIIESDTKRKMQKLEHEVDDSHNTEQKGIQYTIYISFL